MQRGHHVKMEAGIRVMYLEAKEHERLLATTRSYERHTTNFLTL